MASAVVGGGNGTQLASFSLDMNTGVLDMRFNGLVDHRSYTPNLIRIQNSESGEAVVTLTGGTPSQVAGGLEIQISLSQDDINALNIEERVATSLRNTYIFIESGGFIDTQAGNVSTPEAVQVSVLTADEAEPTFIEFVLELNSGQLQLSFSEVILARSVNPTELTIHGDSDIAASSNVVPLTGGTVVSGNSDLILLELSNVDLNALKAVDGFASSPANTYISFTSAFATSAFDIGVQEVNGQPARSVPSDATPPTLDFFTLDLDANSLILTFSEVVEVSPFQVDLFTIQDHPSSPMFSRSLSLSTVCNSYRLRCHHD